MFFLLLLLKILVFCVILLLEKRGESVSYLENRNNNVREKKVEEANAIKAQVVEVNVSVLSGESSNERVGVVIKKDAETEEFYNLVVELKNHSDKVNATNAVESRKNDTQMENESFAKIEELRKKGILSEDDYLQMKASLTTQFKKNNQYTQ